MLDMRQRTGPIIEGPTKVKSWDRRSSFDVTKDLSRAKSWDTVQPLDVMRDMSARQTNDAPYRSKSKKVILEDRVTPYESLVLNKIDYLYQQLRTQNHKKFDGSKKELSKEGDAHLVERGKGDVKKLKLHNQLAHLRAVSLAEMADEHVLARHPRFAEMKHKAMAGKHDGALLELDAMAGSLQRNEGVLRGSTDHLITHGRLNIHSGTIELHDGTKIALGDINSIESDTNGLSSTIKSETKETSASDRNVTYLSGKEVPTTEHRVNLQTRTIEFASGIRLHFDDIDFQATKTDEASKVTTIALKNGNKFTLSELASPAGTTALQGARWLRHKLWNYNRDQIQHLRDLLQAQKQERNPTVLRDAFSHIEIEGDNITRSTFKIKSITAPTSDIEVYDVKSRLKELKVEAIENANIEDLLEESHWAQRQQGLLQARSDYTHMLENQASRDIKANRLAGDAPTYQHIQENRQATMFKDLEKRRRIIDKGLSTDRQEAKLEILQLSEIDIRIEGSNLPFATNRLARLNAIGFADQKDWVAVNQEIIKLQAIPLPDNASPLLKARIEYENQAVEHIRRGQVRQKETGNIYEIPLALREVDLQDQKQHYSEQCILDALDGRHSDPQQRLKELASTFHELHSKPPFLKLTPHSSENMRTLEIPGKNPEEKAANVLNKSWDIARIEVEEMIEKETDPDLRARLIDSREKDIKEYRDKFIDQYNKEIQRQMMLDTLDKSEKILMRFSRRQIFLSFLTNAQMGTQSFDNGIERTLSNMMRGMQKVM